MTGERNRNKNFTEQECYELIRTIKKYAHIIECHDTGVRIKKEAKTAAWNAICRQFNRNTSNNRTVVALQTKWKCDKSNVRDYIQYLKTSQSRSGRTPDNIPKPKFMNVIAKLIGLECAALEPIPDFDEHYTFDDGNNSSGPLNIAKSELPTDISHLSFEQIMVTDSNDNKDHQLNYTHENIIDTSTKESFHKSHAPALVNNYKTHNTYTLPSQIDEQQPHSMNSNNPMIQQLQTELLRKQIEVQELMATELKLKIERTKQLMKMDAQESELRCQEITKRSQSHHNPNTQFYQ